MMDDHSDAFMVWLGKGVKDRTVVHIDAHDDYRIIEDNRISELTSLIRDKKYGDIAKRMNSGRTELMNIGNYLYAAYKTGMIKEIYWVNDWSLESSSARLEWTKQLLIASGYPRDEILRTFKLENGRSTGTIYGIPFTVCSLGDLPAFRRPVLLDIDTDFFVNVITRQPVTLESIIGRFRDDLVETGIPYDIATIAYSLEFDFTPIHYMFLGDAARDVVSNAQLPLSPEKQRTLNLRSGADLAFRQGLFKESAAFDNEILKSLPDDAQANYHLALIHVQNGQYSPALRHAERAASVDRRYYRGLAYLGSLVQEKNYNLALKFVHKAEELSPGRSYTKGILADIYFNRGLFKEALEQYRQLNNGNPAVLMYLGDTCMMMKKYDDALKYYSEGLDVIQKTPYLKLGQFSLSLLFLGEYFESVGKDETSAKQYFDMYLAIPRGVQDQKEAYKTVKEKSRLY